MGIALLLLSAACFGAMAIFGKLAYAAGVSPETLLLVRFALAAALLTLVTAALRPAKPPAKLILVALGLGAIGYALQAGLYFSALEIMDASTLSLIFYTYPVMVALLSREPLTPRGWVALAATTGGTLLGTGAVHLHPLGLVLAFGTAVTYTGYILVSDTVVHRMDPVLLAALVMTGATVATAARSGFTPDLGFSPAGWFWLACIAVVSTVVAMLTFFAGLRRTSPSTAAMTSTFEPVVTTALAALTLGEALTGLQVAGGLLVLSAVVLLQRQREHRALAGNTGHREVAAVGAGQLAGDRQP